MRRHMILALAVTLLLLATGAQAAEFTPSLVLGDFDWVVTGPPVIHDGAYAIYDVWPTVPGVDTADLHVVMVKWATIEPGRGSFPFGQYRTFLPFRPIGAGPLQLSCSIVAYRSYLDYWGRDRYDWYFGIMLVDVLVV